MDAAESRGPCTQGKPFRAWTVHYSTPSQGWLSKLRTHLLLRCLKRDYDGDEDANFSDEELRRIIIGQDAQGAPTVYQHQTLRINYTTYDGRRVQDHINTGDHANIMMLAHEPEEAENPHPYWYARVIGIYHASVLYNDPKSWNKQRNDMDFVWIRWLGPSENYTGGWKAKRLHRVGFVHPKDQSPLFGFLDPANIIRGVHLLPATHYGRSTCGLPPSIARPESDDNKDWNYFYVDM